MRLDMFLIIGIIVNTLFVVLFPTQILGQDPLGINTIEKSKFDQYYTVNGSGFISNYNETTLQVERSDGLFSDLTSTVNSTEGDSGLLIGEAFTFIDWVKVGMNAVKTVFMFVIGFILLLWQLAYPLNFLIGIPFSLMYLFAIASFIMGRQ